MISVVGVGREWPVGIDCLQRNEKPVKYCDLGDRSDCVIGWRRITFDICIK